MNKELLSSKDWLKYPKFRHNLWANYDSEPEVTYLTVSHGKFAVDRNDAEAFLRMRPHCTGHHTADEVIKRSGLEETKARAILKSLAEAAVTRPAYKPVASMTKDEIRSILFAACRIWGEQLAETYISAGMPSGKEGLGVLKGWLLETYHYIKFFPKTIELASRHATGELGAVLTKYAAEEVGHEKFVLECLTNVGFAVSEVEESIPLVSTQLIRKLIEELVVRTPAAALLLAGVVEAGDVDVTEIRRFVTEIAERYHLPADALHPYEQHVIVDSKLGHAELSQRYPHLIDITDEDTVHFVCNQLHDIKHAFDLQSLEIREYYSHPGNYVPRQHVDLFAI
jgi:hypothetical protein